MEKQELLEAFRRMLRIRRFEEEAVGLCETGDIPSGMHSSIGQEAAIVGACMALEKEDYITGTHRSHGHPIGKGADLKPLMAELMGKATGVCKGRGGSMHLTDTRVGAIGESAIVGGGIPLATGAGLSIQIRGTHQVSLCFFGDGAANQGTFAESLNLAAIWRLPVIFLCENNQYAISTPLSKSHGQPDIYKRGDGYGVPGLWVDGQDVVAVHREVCSAVRRARSGAGPTLIEARTYRFDEHCTGLIVPIPYRTPEEVREHRDHRDPIVLFRATLLERGFSDAELDAMLGEVNQEVAQAIAFARESPYPDPKDVRQYLFRTPVASHDRE